MRHKLSYLVVPALFGSTLMAAGPVSAHVAAPPVPLPPKEAVASGYGGAVSSVSSYATQIGIDVLRRGGNAVDAAVATAAALGVVEPFSSGIGGGGFFVYYDARTHHVSTIDGRETGPAAFSPTVFIDPATGKPLAFADAVNSGLSVGVPGTLMTWQKALNAWGTRSLAEELRPAARLAERGFTVTGDFNAGIALNQQRFSDIAPTAQLYLPGGQVPAVGSVFRNPDLAATYDLIARQGIGVFYGGQLAQEIAATAQHPPMTPTSDRFFRPGVITAADIAGYAAPFTAPTHVSYDGLDVYSMAPPSSGGTTVGEALNILTQLKRSGWQLSWATQAQQVASLQAYLEASRVSFADRNRWVADPAYENVPTSGLLSPAFAASRACLISPTSTLTSPVAPGDPANPGAGGCAPATTQTPDVSTEGVSTTHLVTADRWGDVVSYTLTIEQTGGSAMVVPHRGFLLNNEMTDFDFTPIHPPAPDPNLPAAGKRPRSSMAPTIILRPSASGGSRPYLAVGSPGGASIITTVLQILLNRLDLGMSLPDAIAAPRISQRDGAHTEAEPAFLASPLAPALTGIGQNFVPAPPTFTPASELGAATGLEFLGDGRIQAAAEPQRRFGGSAMVVFPLPTR
jgi:gamma-glutamyltranspeptidase/glutathione hydrolase